LRDDHNRFAERLQKVIEKEVDTAARKVDFFKERNPEKAANIIGELEVLKKILTFIKDLAAQYELAIKRWNT
jgi:hypothetical protein